MGRDLVIDVYADELARRLEPRDDVIVREERSDAPITSDGPVPGIAGSATYSAAEGPYRSYERHVSWEPTAAGRFRMTQWVRFWPAIPVFAPLWHRFMRKALRDPKPSTWRPFWALPDRLTPRQSTVLASMAIFHVVGGMLYAFLTNVLTFASADLGDGSAGEQSVILAVSRVGVVLTIATMAFADRVGRRRVAVASAAAAVAFTLASALAPGLVVLAALQTVSRNLAIAAMLAADTVSVEELPAGSRAAAQGLGALSYGLGAGVVVLSLPLADLGDSGWRLVFAASALCIPLVWIAAKHLPESTRFAERDTSVRARKVNPRRFILLAALFFLLNAFVAPSSQLQNDYLRVDRGFAGSRITLFIIVTGMPGLFGILVGGRLADRRGRRLALVPGLLALGGFGALFFVLSGAPMWVAATLAAMLGTLAVPALGVLAPELFPTARRGAARGGLSAMATAGSAAGLLLAGVLVDNLGYGNAFLWLAIGPLIAAVLALGVPETSGVELEDLNEQRDETGRANP